MNIIYPVGKRVWWDFLVLNTVVTGGSSVINLDNKKCLKYTLRNVQVKISIYTEKLWVNKDSQKMSIRFVQ